MLAYLWTVWKEPQRARGGKTGPRNIITCRSLSGGSNGGNGGRRAKKGATAEEEDDENGDDGLRKTEDAPARRS